MASSHLMSRPARLVVALTGAVALALLPALAGSAAPASPADTTRKISALNAQLDKAVEIYDQARLTVSTSKAKQKKLTAAATVQQRRVGKFRQQVGAFASSAYKAGGLTPMASLLDSGSPQNFLDQMATLNHLSQEQRSTLNQLTAAQRVLAQQQQQIASALKTQQTAEKKAAQTKSQLQSDLAKAKALQAQQRAAAAAAAARAAATSSPTASSSSATTSTSRASRGTTRPAAPPAYSGPASGSAAIAVRFAYAQLGKPYVWAAAGPSSYDCSGLTMAAWASAGVSLPHSSAMQFNSAPHVSLSALQPGDLIFYGSPIHHVAMYIGGGQIIHAPVPGETVTIASMDMESPVGAVRP